MSLGDGEAFRCWACTRECYGERIASGNVLICGGCDRLEPCPPVLAPVALSEPAAPPAPPAVEAAKLADASEGATGGCALPSGWYRDHDVSSAPVNRDYKHATGGTWRMQVWHGDDVWQWAKDGGSTRGTAPTMLTAMCAALGITLGKFAHGTLVCADDDRGHHIADGDDEESCARAALEAFAAGSSTDLRTSTLERASTRSRDVLAVGVAPSGEETGAPQGRELHARVTAALRAESNEMRSAARELTASMRPSTSAAPTVERLLELAAEAVKVATDMRNAALEAEGWAARVRAACGGEKR